MRKLLIASIVLGLLPITSAPANAGVITCKYKQIKHLDKNGKMPIWKYSYKHICTYKKYGR